MRIMAVGCVLSMTAEVLNGMIVYKLIRCDISVLFITSDVSYSLVLLNTLVFGRFCISRLDHSSRTLRILFHAMATVTALIILARVIFTDTGLFTFCTKNGDATFGPLDNLQTFGILACDIIIVLMVVSNLRDKNEYVNREQTMTLLVSSLLVTITVLIYALLYLPYIMWLGYMIAILYMFVGLQGMMIYNDELTSLNNRRRMLLDISRHTAAHDTDKESNPWAYILCDVNDFKQVNDNYGHNMGDRALVIIASVMNEISLRSGAKVYRIGGDEFAIMVPFEDESLTQSICDDIDKKLAEYVAKENLPFELSVSTGYAICKDNSQLTVPEVMELADQHMYYRKREKKRLSSGK